MARENDRRLIMLAGDEVRRKMIENNDYKAWYFRSFPHAGTARYNKTKVESHKHQIPIEPQV